MRWNRSPGVRGPFLFLLSPLAGISDSPREVDAVAVGAALPSSSVRRFLDTVRSSSASSGLEGTCLVATGAAGDFKEATSSSSESDDESESEELGALSVLDLAGDAFLGFASSSLLSLSSEVSSLEESSSLVSSVFLADFLGDFLESLSLELSSLLSLELELELELLFDFAADLTFLVGSALTTFFLLFVAVEVEELEEELESASLSSSESPVVSVWLDDRAGEDFFIATEIEGKALGFSSSTRQIRLWDISA